MVDAHPALFRGLTFDAGSGQPLPSTERRAVLLERTDDDFITAFLEELRSDEGRKRVTGSVLNAGEPSRGLLKLRQPVHRSFHLSVFEAACDTFGEPRLDPARIESAGLVVRRIDPTSGKRQGWMKVDGEVRGWVTLEGSAQLDRDPDPSRRGAPFPAGHPEINALLQRTLSAPEPYEESVSLLFVAPPPVCAAARRTILYGLVPVASAERVSRQVGSPPRYEEEDLRALLAPYFTGPGVSLDGLQGRAFSSRYADDLASQAPYSTDAGAREAAGRRLEQFVSMLRLLVSVFNAFEHAGMRAALNRVRVSLGLGSTRPLGDLLVQAADVFVFARSSTQTFVMPQAWPSLSTSDFAALLQAAADASATRLSTTQLSDVLQQRGRFDVTGARYEVRGFIRVRREDGCPPVLHWSEPSQPFEIAAWFESGKLPPVQVPLPSVTRTNIKDFLPNVAFQVPAPIFDLLSRNSPKDFLEQKAREGSAGGVDWICGFNIPIITLCAFIVLNIFLSLLNILFWWLPFIKICIPLPRRR